MSSIFSPEGSGGGSRLPRTPPIASAFGDTDGEIGYKILKNFGRFFFRRTNFQPTKFSAENIFDQKSFQQRTLLANKNWPKQFSPKFFFRPNDFWPKTMSMFFDFLSSPGFPRIPRPLPDQKNWEDIKNIDFYEKSENCNFSGNRNFQVGGTQPEGPVKSYKS